MSPRKHIPPSRKRYVRENPTVSIRLTKDLKELLDEARGEASYGQFIKQLLLQQKGRIKHVFNEGYKKALEDWQIFVPCDECKKKFPILADPEDGQYQAVMDHIKMGGVLCEKCASK